MKRSTTLVIVALVITGGHSLVGQGRHRTPATPPAAADPFAAPANRIIAANCKPGNPSTEWDINGAGDPTIQGFATDISYNLGETARFKVKTDAPKYRIDIYRLGYYGGLGARFMGTVRPSAALPQQQPPCIADWSVRLYDCGNWGLSASWPISQEAISGVYVARLVREDEGGTWRMDNSRSPGARPAAVPHAYGALGHGKLRNPLKNRAPAIVRRARR